MLLKFDKSDRVEEIRVEDSGYVKPVFSDFIKDFEDSQKLKNTQFVELKYKAAVKIIEKDPDTGKPIGKPKTRTIERFIEAQTVYGGDEGVKLYINYTMVHVIRRLQDSSVYEKINNQYLCFEKKSKRTHKI